MYIYYKNVEELMYWLRKKCKIYVKETSFELLGKYLIGENDQKRVYLIENLILSFRMSKLTQTLKNSLFQKITKAV